MEEKRNENLAFRPMTSADLDRDIVRVIELWKLKRPLEHHQFCDAVLKYKKLVEERQSAKAPLWLIGQIPPSLEFQIHWMWPGFWQEPKNIVRFFRIFSLGAMPRPKTNVHLVRA